MWEEHPEYQKSQARMIGLLILGAFIYYLGSAIIDRDWELFKNTLKAGGCFLTALGILSGSVWILVKLFTRQPSKSSRPKKPLNG